MRPEPEVNYAVDPYGYRPMPRHRAGVGMVVVVVCGLGLAGAAAVYYGALGLRPSGVIVNPDGGPPMIEPDPTPTKTRPENPGGVVVPHQDKRVYERLQNAKLPPDVERLLPPPEEPLPRPLVAPPVPGPVSVTAPTLATVAKEAPAAAPAPPLAETPSAAAVLPEEPVQGPAVLLPARKPLAAGAPRPQNQPAVVPVAHPDPQPAATESRAIASAKAAPAITTAPAPVSGGGRWRIQLASVRSEDDAKSEWRRLTSRFPDELAGMTFQTTRIDLGGDKGVYIRVQGAAADEEHARTACAHLRAQNVGCVLVRP